MRVVRLDLAVQQLNQHKAEIQVHTDLEMQAVQVLLIHGQQILIGAEAAVVQAQPVNQRLTVV
jgi:hypothetical protein